ncbi:MAG: formimidoylglutamate deiminase [Rhodospirillales bacterium]
MPLLLLEHALTGDGWKRSVLLEWDATGDIVSLRPESAPVRGVETVSGAAIPGLANLHSHAFQRAIAGVSESLGAGGDTFWTWRQAMYRAVERLTPENLGAVAALAFAEMLEGGFTSVAEFHYIHNNPDGRPYARRAAMAEAVIAAAKETGIGLTLLPVFYAHGGFGGKQLESAQRRFGSNLDGFARLADDSAAALRALPGSALGIAPHSLRAVAPAELRRLVQGFAGKPFHIHAAEQLREVEECVASLGRRPVEWLLDEMPIDRDWCLVHSTHLTAEETARLAGSGAVAALCPVTEANLGDGIFPASAYLRAGGRLGVGTDSNIRIDAAEELRQLEYSQRLRDRARNVLAEQGRSTGRVLFDAAASSAAQVLARRVGALEPGKRADFLVLDTGHLSMLGRAGDAWLDSWIFAAGKDALREVRVGGRRVVAGGRHREAETIRRRYAGVLNQLTGGNA